MDQNNQNIDPQQVNQAQPPQYIPPVYTEPKSQKILRETGTVVATAGMIAGLVATIKSLFAKK